jgi:sugar phosphate isomerase/epimerase
VLRIAEAVGTSRMTVVRGFDRGDYSEQELVDGFARLCTKAADVGVAVDLEFMAIFGIDTLELALAIVAGADMPNGKLLVDTWHLNRGDNAAGPSLESVPAGLLRQVQLADGHAVMEAPTLMEDSKHHRRFPGQGDFPCAEQLEVLWAKGTIESIGVEVFSKEADLLSPVEAGRLAGDTLRQTLAAAGIA